MMPITNSAGAPGNTGLLSATELVPHGAADKSPTTINANPATTKTIVIALRINYHLPLVPEWNHREHLDEQTDEERAEGEEPNDDRELDPVREV